MLAHTRNCILHNLDLHKPLMRKVFTTEPLWRINVPLQRISEPLRRKIEHPLCRIIQPSCAIIDPPWRIIERVCFFTEAVEGKPKYFQGRHKPVPPYRNIELVYGINKDFGGKQNAKKFQVARACQTVECKILQWWGNYRYESCGEPFPKFFCNYF